MKLMQGGLLPPRAKKASKQLCKGWFIRPIFSLFHLLLLKVSRNSKTRFLLAQLFILLMLLGSS